MQIRFRVPPLRRWWWLVVVVAAVMVTYVFIISAGTWSTWPTWNANYNQLAEGFRAGHLYIPAAPAPELLARPNPFDWSNSHLWYLDASLYKGHYYLYWGPVPALFLLAVKVLARTHAEIGDQYSLFAYYTLLLIAGTVLIARVTTRLFPLVPRALIVMAVLAFAYVSPTTYMFATPGIYQSAIGAAQAFLVLGLVVAFESVWNPSGRPSGRGVLIAAGCCWGAAVGCRITAILPASAFVSLTALFATDDDWRRWRGLVVRLVCLGAPVALVLLGLAAYNRARFDSWFEIGVKYQLNTFPYVTSVKYVPLGIYSYLLRPLGFSCRFPFVSALYDIGARGFPKGTVFPPGYSTHEPQAGLFVTSPWTWLFIPALVVAAERALRWKPSRTMVLDRTARAHVWCVGSFLALSLLMPMVLVPGFDTTMRYVADFSTGFTLFATWGAWMLLERLPRGWPRWTGIVVLVGLCVATVVIGLLLGWEGYDQTFKWHNPQLYEAVRAKFSLCK